MPAPRLLPEPEETRRAQNLEHARLPAIPDERGGAPSCHRAGQRMLHQDQRKAARNSSHGAINCVLSTTCGTRRNG